MVELAAFRHVGTRHGGPSRQRGGRSAFLEEVDATGIPPAQADRSGGKISRDLQRGTARDLDDAVPEARAKGKGKLRRGGGGCLLADGAGQPVGRPVRSEERRVGKERG